MASIEEINELMDEKFKIQEQSLLNIITGNSTIVNEKIERLTEQVKSFNERIERMERKQKELEMTVDEFKTSLEFTQGLIDDKIKELDKTLNEKIEGIKQINKQQRQTQEKRYEEEQAELKDKLRTLEDRNRRNNLRIDGIKETEGENSEEIEQKVRKLFEDRMDITKDIDIERITGWDHTHHEITTDQER